VIGRKRMEALEQRVDNLEEQVAAVISIIRDGLASDRRQAVLVQELVSATTELRRTVAKAINEEPHPPPQRKATTH